MQTQSVGGIVQERLNLLWDNVFKAVFTRDTPASREARLKEARVNWCPR
jgi:hypothetical protein